jgi:hypothetical protein
MAPATAKRAAGLEAMRISGGLAPQVGEAITGFEVNSIKMADAVGNLAGSATRLNELVGGLVSSFSDLTVAINEMLGGGKGRKGPRIVEK